MRLFLIFLILIPAVIGQECLQYSDCRPADCPGAARFCIKERCVYSDCIAGKRYAQSKAPSIEEIFGPYSLGFKDGFGTKQILLIGLKVVILAVVAIILISLIALANLPPGWKTVMVIFFAILEIILALILFLGNSFLIGLFAPSEITWKNAYPEHFVPKTMETAQLDKRAISNEQREQISPKIKDASEFRIGDLTEEVRFVVIGLDSKEHIINLTLPEPLMKEESLLKLNDEIILMHNRGEYATLIWDEDRFLFMLTAKNSSIIRLAEEVLERYPTKPKGSALYRNDITPPVIKTIFPENNTIMRDTRLSFEVTDEESEIEEINVLNLEGFVRASDCRLEMKSWFCSFRPEGLVQGRNTALIRAKDNYGNSQEILTAFLYDTEAWEIIEMHPAYKGITNSPRISFKIIDRISGIDRYSLIIKGMNISSQSIKEVDNGLECVYFDYGMQDGEHEILISAKDNSGNAGNYTHLFTYDSVKPNISISASGFAISDNFGVDAGSVRVNRRPFDLSTCQEENGTYNCRMSQVTEVTAIDLAGNMHNEVSRLVR